MPGDGQPQAAVFTEDGGAIFLGLGRAGAGIDVNIMGITGGKIVPPAGADRQPRGIERDHQQIAREPAELSQHCAQLVASFDGPIGELKDGGAIFTCDRLGHVEQQIAPDEPQHRRDIFGRDRRPGKRDDLVERALRVASGVTAPRISIKRRVAMESSVGGDGGDLDRNRPDAMV